MIAHRVLSVAIAAMTLAGCQTGKDFVQEVQTQVSNVRDYLQVSDAEEGGDTSAQGGLDVASSHPRGEAFPAPSSSSPDQTLTEAVSDLLAAMKNDDWTTFGAAADSFVVHAAENGSRVPRESAKLFEFAALHFAGEAEAAEDALTAFAGQRVRYATPNPEFDLLPVELNRLEGRSRFQRVECVGAQGTVQKRGVDVDCAAGEEAQTAEDAVSGMLGPMFRQAAAAPLPFPDVERTAAHQRLLTASLLRDYREGALLPADAVVRAAVVQESYLLSRLNLIADRNFTAMAGLVPPDEVPFKSDNEALRRTAALARYALDPKAYVQKSESVRIFVWETYGQKSKEAFAFHTIVGENLLRMGNNDLARQHYAVAGVALGAYSPADPRRLFIDISQHRAALGRIMVRTTGAEQLSRRAADKARTHLEALYGLCRVTGPDMCMEDYVIYTDGAIAAMSGRRVIDSRAEPDYRTWKSFQDSTESANTMGTAGQIMAAMQAMQSMRRFSDMMKKRTEKWQQDAIRAMNYLVQ